MTEWLKIILECSQLMKKEAVKYYGSPEAAIGFGVGAGGDISKKIDVAAEKALIDCLNRHDVSCTLVSEEAGTKQIGSEQTEYYIITDPVDGTTNAIRGLPFSANVIAVSNGPLLQDVEAAVVSDIFHGVTYIAEKNKGAYKNGKKIEPAQTTSLKDAVIGIDLNTFKTEEVSIKLQKLFRDGKHFRHFGANGLEICYVADGSTDAFIDIRGKLRVTDMVASYLILREAGGFISTPDGEELNLPLTATQRLSFIAAANKKIYEAIKKTLSNKS